MTTVNITRRYRGKIGGEITPGYVGGGNSAIPIDPINTPPGDTFVAYPEPAIFYFVGTSLPTITTFNVTYSPTYGRNPRFTLIVFEGSLVDAVDPTSENELVQYIPPKLTIVDDEITEVLFDLSGLGNVSGKIIINK